MRPAVNRVDVIGETENAFRISVVVLQPNLHSHVIALGFHVDWLVMKHLLAAVKMLNELGNATVVFELCRFGFASLGVSCALIGERDQQAFVEESQFTEALRKGVVVVFSTSGEDGLVRQEADFGPPLFRGTGLLQLAGGLAFGICLLPGKSITPNLQL